MSDQSEPQPQAPISSDEQAAAQPGNQTANQAYAAPAAQVYYAQAPAPAADILTGGEKAYVVILSIFFSIIVPITMWFCWRQFAPEKAKKALVWGLVTCAIVLAVNFLISLAFFGLIFATMQGGMYL